MRNGNGKCAENTKAASCDYCFPNKTEEIRVLETAIQMLNSAPMAKYYLGNLLYDKKQYDRAASLREGWNMTNWQKS
ncbi:MULTISPECIES: hypothetical protein [Blautia]|uniref:Tetratricopeptide repeat protein n=1 Tax=Blautia celeris TaxID=2763026 RepID=A0ABR7FCB0_9FIRM|nr:MULTISPECIES: hypothetical protein [Blautia]MCB6722638.1 hypothetical protein [Blautia marasmi]MCI5962873.1 hypothetical protein [Clostridia bacterium]MBC5672847.1 hypothetical protein [Blautia celeris]MCA5963062.1 hypothetical protein [Blautia parvula]MCB4355227.1 hypothetical protein [Blautia sp. RD014232]